MRDDLVLTKGTKQDLVEGGRRGDGSVHVDRPEVSVHRDYEERGGFRWSKCTTYDRPEARYRPPELTLAEHAQLGKSKLAVLTH